MQYPLVPVPCGHCRATRVLGTVHHEPACPTEVGNVAFFTHPDLMDLEAHFTSFYLDP